MVRRVPGIGVVLNPKSRRNLQDAGAATRLARTLGDHGVVRAARSIDELHLIATDFKRLGIDILGISGGDLHDGGPELELSIGPRVKIVAGT